MSVCRCVVGKVVFAEVMLAALAFSGDCYYDNSWRRAAAMVTSPPLRPPADVADFLLNGLAKYSISLPVSLCRLRLHTVSREKYPTSIRAVL